MPTWEDSSNAGDWNDVMEEHRKAVDRNSEKLVKLILQYQLGAVVLGNLVDVKRLAQWLAEHGVTA